MDSVEFTAVMKYVHDEKEPGRIRKGKENNVRCKAKCLTM